MQEGFFSTLEAAIKHLPLSLQEIIKALRGQDQIEPDQVVQIIEQANVIPSDLEPWADFDHPVADSYGRKLVYKFDNFEIMVMSWCPGDFSTIHDHGYTQWGAVQIFGPAEHACFRIEENQLETRDRWLVTTGDLVPVQHSLIHQMGNPSQNQFFLSLHVYGNLESTENVTGDARVYELDQAQIQRVDGGVFFALPDAEIKRREAGPKGDFPSLLRYRVELLRRLQRVDKGQREPSELTALIERTYDTTHHPTLVQYLKAITDKAGHTVDSKKWRILNQELKAAANLQNNLKKQLGQKDSFHQYASLYDAVIGKPCLESFMQRYILFFAKQYHLDFSDKSLLSLGCGTGLVEQFMMEAVGFTYQNIYGIDISDAMVTEARKRIQADKGDILSLDPSLGLWDVAFSGLNVFHYLNHQRLEEAIQKTAAIVKPGGYFLGDFITPDHIRWYPNLIFSEDEKVISLRTPKLVEEHGRTFQESEIINLNFWGEQMEINYAGKHKRFLPPMHRMRTYFQNAFKGEVYLYDAYSLELLPEWADSCPSTRYIVVAKKAFT